MHYRFPCQILLFVLLLPGLPLRARADDEIRSKKQVETVYPIAVLPFRERGQNVEELGGKVTDLLFAHLATPEMYLVDREELQKLIDEQELNLSGLVNPAEATQVGYYTGAKILVTGSVLEVGDRLYIVAKVIGTETTRVLGTSVKGDIDGELGELVEELAAAVISTVSDRAGDLIAAPVTREDRIAGLRKVLGKGQRPTVFIDVSEQHVGQVANDPAAETEIALFCTELGFNVIDSDDGDRRDADVLLIGEGFSEFAARHGDLISVKSRLELKAIDRKTNRVLAIDRHVSVGVDLAEHIGAKASLQEAAANIAVRLLPKIVVPEKGKGKKNNKASK